MRELFGAESKSQVYAHLHDVLQKPEMQTTGMSYYAVLHIIKTYLTTLLIRYNTCMHNHNLQRFQMLEVEGTTTTT